MKRTYETVTGQALHYFVRAHSAVPNGPVHSPAGWRGSELLAATDWSETLTARDIGELDGALRHARGTGKPLAALTASDFPLPTLATRIERWRANVSDGRGVQLVRGIPVDRWAVNDCERVFWCLGQHLGRPGAQNKADELLGHVRDQGVSFEDLSVRGYQTTARLGYHCDAADAVGLLCLRGAKSGGRSRFVSSVAVWNELFARRPDLARRMFEPFELDTRGDGGVDFFDIAPCRYADGVLRTFYHSDYFRTAERQPGARPLTAFEHEVLDTYDAIANTEGMYVEMDFEPGDIQLLSNHTVLHSRTAYVDFDEPDRKRHLLRLWLSFSTPRSLRALPSLGRDGVRLLRGLVVGRLRKRWARIRRV